MDRWLNNVNVVRVAAVLLGILLWLVVKLNVEQITPGPTNPVFQTDTIVDAKVITRGLDQGQYHLYSITPSEVDIIVEGTSSALNRIPTSQYAIVADLTGLTEGTHQVALIAENFPRGVDVTLQPDTVSITIERMEMKQFDVIIELTGHPEDGLQAGVPVANPSRVHATVPTGRLQEVHSIRGNIDVQGATDTVVREVKLEAYDANGRLLPDVTINPSIVSVEVPINPPFRSVPLQIGFTGNPPPGQSVVGFVADTSFVTIYGPQEAIDAIDFYEGVMIDLSTLTGDSTVSVEIPLLNQLSGIEPREVQVSIDLEPTVQRTFNSVPIRLFGDSEQYDIEMTEPSEGVITLTVEGAAALVNDLTAGDVQVILDVSNIAPGNYVLPLRINLPRFVNLAASSELRASLTVTEPSEPVSGEEDDGTAGEGDDSVEDAIDEEEVQPPVLEDDQEQQANGGQSSEDQAVGLVDTGSASNSHNSG